MATSGMMSRMTVKREISELEELKQSVKKFCEDRDWDRFHGIKDLSIGVVTEGAELLEIFRFLDEAQAESLMVADASREKVQDELADVLFFLLRISGRYKIDLAAAIREKIRKNGLKYPVEKSRGKNTKYDAL